MPQPSAVVSPNKRARYDLDAAAAHDNAFVNDPDAGERGQDVEDAKHQPKKRKIEFIQNNVNRYKTFSKRKAGIMKKVCFV